MSSAFRKISRIGSLTGGTRWYLNDDCLLAAKRMMYAVEYRRFYLRDLESVVVWPSRSWPLRLIIPGVLLAALSASLWRWVNSTAGEVFAGLALAWVGLELALGPTARSRIRTTGANIEMPLVQRTRRARKVLARIDAAVCATRGNIQPLIASTVATQPAAPLVEEPETSSIAAATETNAS